VSLISCDTYLQKSVDPLTIAVGASFAGVKTLREAVFVPHPM